MRVGHCAFGWAMLIALGGCGGASADGRAEVDQRSAAPASIGGVDCSTLSVPITLDNTAALATRVFVVELRGGGRSHKVVKLTAGDRRSFNLAVKDHRQAVILIRDEADGDVVTLERVDCTHRPAFDARAMLQQVNCSDHTLPVELDNSRSEIAADFSLESSDGGPGKIRFNRTFRVPPGEKTVVHVPVGHASIEFNAQLVDPPDGVDEWLGDGEGLEYNDYIFRVPCR